MESSKGFLYASRYWIEKLQIIKLVCNCNTRTQTVAFKIWFFLQNFEEFHVEVNNKLVFIKPLNDFKNIFLFFLSNIDLSYFL